MVLNFLKNIARKTLLASAEPTGETKAIYERLGEFLAERTFYFGDKKMRVNSLAMESAPGTAETIIQMLQKTGMEGAKILDFGCGQHQSQYLKKMGFNVHSCDILDMGTSNFTKIDPADAVLPFSDGQFDIVIASEVLEHVESPWEILKELARVSRRHIIITTPNPASIKSRKQFATSGFLYWFAPDNFEYHMSPIFWWQVELFCKRYNFQLTGTSSNHQAFKLSDGGQQIKFAEAFIYQISKIL